LLEKLVIYPENMLANLDRLGGLVHSQRVLLALTQAGISREDAYRLVQSEAMKVWAGEGHLLELLSTNKTITDALPKQELEKLFDLAHHMKHVDTIFDRVFGQS